MRQIIVLVSVAALCGVAWASGVTPVETELVGCSVGAGQSGRSGLDELHTEPAFSGSRPGALWEPLEEMSAAERANAEIWLEPGPEAVPGAREEAKEISRLWNSGSCDVAIRRMQGLHRLADPRRVMVAVSWRTPVETRREIDWGPDIRIGNRDSLFGCMFDRSGVTGHLFAAFPKRGLSQTFLFSYRSTDNGRNWSELAYVYWVVTDNLEAWSAACHGDYWQISWVNGVPANRVWAARISTTTGQWVRFPGDSLAVIPFESASGDSIRELAVCTGEDVRPGARIYIFGCTKNRLLYFSWTDSSCRAWRPHSTNVNYCDGGLDCTYNAGCDSNYLWASWMRNFDDDSAKLGFGWFTSVDTLFHRSWFSNVYTAPTGNYFPTSITARNDTIQMGFIHRSTRQVRHVYCHIGGQPWYQDALCDSGTYKDQVEVCGRREGGFAVGYRYYGRGSDRSVQFRHAAAVQGPYTDPERVNDDHRPLPMSRIRMENLGSGQYGMVWVNWDDSIYRAAWFDRITLTGIEQPDEPEPVPLGLLALPRTGGVRLAFDNPAQGPVRVRVFDLTGRLHQSLDQSIAAGRQSIDVVPGASGVYFAVVEAGGRRASTMFSFAR